MSRPKLQLFYLIISFMLIVSFLFYGVSQLLAFYESGTNSEELITIDTQSVNRYYQPKIVWQEPIINDGRKMEANTLDKISKDYLASYYHQFQALKTSNTLGLDDYYTENPRAYLKELVQWHSDNKQSVSGTTIEHHTHLDFYSEDGTIVSLTDHVISFQKIAIEGINQTTAYDTSSYRVMLLLEDNFWRIRHKVREGIPHDWNSKTIYSPRSAMINGHQLFIDSTAFVIKGMNYYPQNHPWELMWSDFDNIDFDSDFSMIKQSGFNTLRIFIPYGHFGAAEVKASELDKLNSFMDKADTYDLKVIVTLFDFFLGYKLEEWTLSDRHAETIVNNLKDHPALLAWDLKNEPDLDFEQSGQEQVLEWLSFITDRIKRYDPKALVTIGWSQPEHMALLEEKLDFLSFHFYRNPEELAFFLQQNKFEKPLFLGETGMHSFKNWWYPIGNDEQDQQKYYLQITKLIQDHQLNYAFWTLYDFRKVPANVAGKWPWQRKPQKAYGLIRSNGREKESFALIKAFNQTNQHD